MSEPSRAVFLSYASEDAEAAQRICAALRGGGIEVWFDQSELRGGDVWDRQIRKQIHDCALFVPIISAHSQARLEGYFRREWKLAAERTHDMAEEKAFLVPVVIDGTSERGASVPDKFREVQWTRLTTAETPQSFVARVSALLSEPVHHTVRTPGPSPARGAVPPGTLQLSFPEEPRRRNAVRVGILVIVVLALTYFVTDKFWLTKRTAKTGTSTPAVISPAAAPPIFAPPPHSVAVLPFTNLSGDPKQEYFSDGMSEELINALSHIAALEVIARTSSFSFRGQDLDTAAIARRLNVAAILEGSVRRSGREVRVTVQLVDAVNGYNMWSQDYDRDLRNVLALQTDIARRVAQKLQVRLLADEAAKIGAGGTHSPEAYDAYLRGLHRLDSGDSKGDILAAAAAFDQAIALDPTYADAYAQRARALSSLASFFTTDLNRRATLFATVRQAAERAVALAPNSADAHTVLGWEVLVSADANFRGGARELARAVQLAPASAYILRIDAILQSALGHHAIALAEVQRSVVLDPESYVNRTALAEVLFDAHRFEQALIASKEAIALNLHGFLSWWYREISNVALGRFEDARQECESPSTPLPKDDRLSCLALAYHGLGQVAKANSELQALKALDGDSDAYGYAEIYAQFGEAAAALKWLETAVRIRDPNLLALKVDWTLDPIRNEPEFKALERRLNFPP